MQLNNRYESDYRTWYRSPPSLWSGNSSDVPGNTEPLLLGYACKYSPFMSYRPGSRTQGVNTLWRHPLSPLFRAMHNRAMWCSKPMPYRVIPTASLYYGATDSNRRLESIYCNRAKCSTINRPEQTNFCRWYWCVKIWAYVINKETIPFVGFYFFCEKYGNVKNKKFLTKRIFYTI